MLWVIWGVCAIWVWWALGWGVRTMMEDWSE